MTYLMPEDVPEEDFTTITDINSIYDLFNEEKISLRELDRLKDTYYRWYYSPEQRTTVLRFYRQPDGTMTIYKQEYIQTYGESGNPNTANTYWVVPDGRIFHSCHAGTNVLVPDLKTFVSYGYYEDGYFRGMRKGHYSKFLNETAQETWIKCKACGEKYVYKDPNTAIGTCYEDAWRFLIKEEEGCLVHGSAQLSAEGPRVNHAWVELPAGWAWEPQTKSYYTIEDFKILSPVEEQRYNVEEAAIMVARVGKHGPWSAEERMKHIGR